MESPGKVNKKNIKNFFIVTQNQKSQHFLFFCIFLFFYFIESPGTVNKKNLNIQKIHKKSEISKFFIIFIS